MSRKKKGKYPEPPGVQDKRLSDILFTMRRVGGGLRKLVPSKDPQGIRRYCFPGVDQYGIIIPYEVLGTDDEPTEHTIVSLEIYYDEVRGWMSSLCLRDADDLFYSREAQLTYENWVDQVDTYNLITEISCSTYSYLESVGFF